MMEKWKDRNKKIFKRYSNGESVADLCKAFNLSQTRIDEIIRQLTWSKLTKKLDKKGKGPNFLNSTIQDLNISTLTVNKLFRYGVYTIKDLENKLPDIEKEQYLSKRIIESIKGSILTFKSKSGAI